MATAMFPLGMVLLPHMPLPLRLFERRYLIMLGRLLEEDEPEFGVVLIERGAESGDHDAQARFGIGTMARITHVAAGEDDVQLLARGTRRVEVVEWLPDDPYPQAVVRELPELEWDDDLAELRARAEDVVRRFRLRVSEFAELGADADVELDDDPVASSWQLAGIAPLGPLDLQRLLRATSLRELLSRLIEAAEEASQTLGATAVDAVDEELAAMLGRDEPDDDDEAESR
ncbi:LON peptidase substrate-binding domain-containing protein [Pseudolysinimonas sp.]|uniref:LON peptidase substrate-binding domain-containing protein n=1 Tax=Pseudolysinimonas sp. TaxID=2680009 RepID=UPI003F7ECD58